MLSWRGSFVRRKCKKVWRAALLCIFWTLWKERNRREFENTEQLVHSLKSLFMIKLLHGLGCMLLKGTLSLFDFVDWVESN